MTMEEKRPWKMWFFILFTFVGSLHFPVVESVPQYEDYGRQARGDVEAEPVSNAGLGFSGVEQRHDGYVKGETPTIPQTSFRCSGQPYNPGLYADVEANCQVYHVCFEDRQESFLCGPGTNFNQRILACDFWYNFNCQESPSFYDVNADIGKIPETAYRPTIEQTSGGRQTPRPSYPSYPPPQQRPIPESGSYQPPRVSVPPPPPVRPQQPRPQPPRPQPPGQPPRARQPPSRPFVPQQEIDNGYDKEESYRPQRPISVPPPPPLPPSRPTYRTTPKPVFPPVVSPPRVSRPPVRPPVIISPPIQPTRPRVPSRPPSIDVHPGTDIKGGTGFVSPQQPPRVPSPPPRVPQPSQPIDTGYPSYPKPGPVSQRPIDRPTQRPYRPPQPPSPPVQQEHVDVDYIPPPPPRRPSRPSIDYVPPPPPPPPPVVEQVAVAVKPDYPRPKPPSRPSTDYVPPPSPPRQPPSLPSVITEQQRRPSPPPSRPQIHVTSRPRQPQQRPRPVFPPASDHPNANIKGGPGYRPPPPPPRFEPTRIGSRPSGSTSQTGYQPPPQPQKPQPPRDPGYEPPLSVKPTGGRRPITTGQVHRRPPPDRVKQPTQPVGTGYEPPRIPAFPPSPPQIDHPDSGIKGATFEQPSIPRQPPRVISPSTSVSGVKRPPPGSGYQRPRPQPPSLPSTSIKTSKPSTPSETYQPPRPQPPAVPPKTVKKPSQTIVQEVLGQTPERPQSGSSLFPAPRPQPIDHPNANVKGGPGYHQPRQQPARVAQPGRGVVNRPVAPSTITQQKTSPPHQDQSISSGYPSKPAVQRPYRPRGDEEYTQQEVVQEVYKPEPVVISTIKDTSYQKRPQSHPSQQIVRVKQPQQDFGGSSYKRGPDTYPKPEFGQPGRPYQPISTPSRSSQTVKQGSPSQTRYVQENKPQTSRHPSSTGTSGRGRQPDYPYREVPGHQPPHQPQVFPHRDNPDHPNESIKGTNAYRPPPPADYQAAASEIHEESVSEEESARKEDSVELQPAPSSQLGDTGSE